MVTRLRSSTDGMARPSSSWEMDRGSTDLRPRAPPTRRDASPRRSAAASITPPGPMLGFARARGERAVDFVRRQRPDADVTSRSPRSLCGSRSRAGARSIAGWPADRRRWRSASPRRRRAAAEEASTVTASAMPSEKLRPRQPEVATPRTRSPAPIVARPNGSADPGADHADRERSPGADGARCRRRR